MPEISAADLPAIPVHMKTAKSTLGLILVFLSVLAVAAGSTNFSFKAEAYLAKLTHEEKFSGAVLVATNGNVIFSKGYGLANREHESVSRTLEAGGLSKFTSTRHPSADLVSV